MWIICIIILIGAFLICFATPEIKDNTIKVIFNSIIVIMSFAIIVICSFDSVFITDTIKDYENGKIVRQEKIIIEGTDTTKVVKYRYK